MSTFTDSTLYPSDTRTRVRAINEAIRSEERKLRARHPWLAHQDLLGSLCFCGSLAAMAGIVALYLTGNLPWWVATLSMALAISILHEIEHDLMHNLYFKRSPWIQNVMFTITWASKLSMSPWARRQTHLNHHKESGQVEDLEERLIGMGTASVPFRLLMAYVPLTGSFLTRAVQADQPKFNVRRLYASTIPVLVFFDAVMLLALGYLVSRWVSPAQPYVLLPAALEPYVLSAAVLWTLPNLLRQSSLVLISSYSHYYEDIPRNDVFYQNQIFDHVLVSPFNLFVFDFGRTHVIHHYVVDQPFYLRQMLSYRVISRLKELGVRSNDFGIIRRANRWGAYHPKRT